MENLNYNLSEQEFTKGRKILLWIFAILFFIAGVYIIIINLVLRDKTIHIIISLVPFGISIMVSLIAFIATFKKSQHYFIVDADKIEYIYGMFKTIKRSFKWQDIKEICLPHKQKKVMLIFNDGTSFIINLTWIEKKKSSHIRKHIYYSAREKNINIIKVQRLGS
jgi:hypothetical protein